MKSTPIKIHIEDNNETSDYTLCDNESASMSWSTDAVYNNVAVSMKKGFTFKYVKGVLNIVGDSAKIHIDTKEGKMQIDTKGGK